MRLVFQILGYLGTIYVGISSLMFTEKVMGHFRKKAMDSNSKFSYFFCHHWYGFAILLWIFLLFCVMCIPFHLDSISS